MSTREDAQSISSQFELPTERDLDRLTAAIRSEGEKCGFPQRVSGRYQQWIFLFVGWCLKAPPGEVSRDRIGDFWAALSEHSGVGKARMCEAMDALGFFFGHLHREARLVFSLGETGKGEAKKRRRGGEEGTEEFARPNPSLQMHDTEQNGPPSTEALSNRQLSRYLPGGTLPEEPEARSVIPTQEVPQKEENPGESSDVKSEGSGGEEERSPRDRPATLFNPEGRSPPPSPSDSSDASGTPDSSVEPTQDEPDVPSSQEESQSKRRKEGASEEGNEKEEVDRVSIQLPCTVADRLQKAARRLGLPPSVFAARAIELVCDDAGIERLETPDAESPLERYQTQIDLIGLQEEQLVEAGPVSDDQEDEAPRSDRRHQSLERTSSSSNEDADTGQQASKEGMSPKESGSHISGTTEKAGPTEIDPSPGFSPHRLDRRESRGNRTVSGNE